MTHLTLLEISRFTAQTFIAGLWQGIVLIAAVALGLKLLPRLSSTICSAVWSVTFALVATLPLLHLHLPTVPQAQSQAAPIHLSSSWGFAIAAIWAFSMAVRATQLLVQAIRLRRIWKQAAPIAADDAILALLQHSKRTAQLCTSTDVDSPSVIGFLSPRLLIPQDLYEKITQLELHQIILHECEHLRRRDDWINLLQKISLVLFPLNPALLWVDRRLGLEREFACDAGVVAATSQPFDYAYCLTHLAEHRIRVRSIALSLSAWSRQSELARRVHSLLKPMSTMSPLQARASIALLGLGLAGGAIEMARAPHLVSFADTIAAPLQQAATSTLAPATIQATPVTYRDSAQPHETLLKAVMPVAKTAQPSKLRTTHSKPAPRQPRMVLTSAYQDEIQTMEMHHRHHSINREAARAAYLMQTDFSPSYAAVPFGNGWLIIQL